MIQFVVDFPVFGEKMQCEASLANKVPLVTLREAIFKLWLTTANATESLQRLPGVLHATSSCRSKPTCLHSLTGIEK